METRITKLFNIDYPIIQAGMVWVSGWKLAVAVLKEIKPAGDVVREIVAQYKQAVKRLGNLYYTGN